MVVYRYGQHFLCVGLPNDVLVQNVINFGRHWQLARLGGFRSLCDFLADNVVTQFDTFIANKNRGTGDQFADFMLAFATEGAVQQLA